ncbi:TPA: hypothetical protein N2D99_002031 [Clostridium botulinum]|nr:hypothetical protein [Clostridium botulinum]
MSFKKKILGLLTVTSIFVGLLTPLKPVYAVGSPTISVSYNRVNETNAVINIKTQNVSKLRLPDGNWLTQSEVNYSVSQNGTYDFEGISSDGTRVQNGITIQDLRKNILVTSKRDVLLQLHAEDTLSGVYQMRFKNETTGTYSEYEPYKTLKDWTINSGEGLKTVFVQYKDLAGNEANPISDQIYLDNTAPLVTNFTINNGATYTKDRNVTLNISAIDNLSYIDKVYVSNDGTTWKEYAYSTTLPWTLSSDIGDKTVYIKVKDGVGNISSPISKTIYLDTVLPYGSILINNGEVATNSRDVTLSIKFGDNESGVKAVRVIEGSKTYEFPTIPSNPTNIPWTLGLGLTGKVTLEVEDKAGNINRIDSNTINIITLEITQFKLTNVVNPTKFNSNSPFIPVSWDFPPKPMMAGGDISFELFYNLYDQGALTSLTNGDYTIEIIGDNGYYYKTTIDYINRINVPGKGFDATYTIPIDAPNNARVYLTSTVKSTITTPTATLDSQATFPLSGTKAQIGYINGNIKKSIRFNEVR